MYIDKHLVRKGMDVNEHEKLFNITQTQIKEKKRNITLKVAK